MYVIYSIRVIIIITPLSVDCVVIPLLAQYRCANRNYDSLGMEGGESVESVESYSWLALTLMAL